MSIVPRLRQPDPPTNARTSWRSVGRLSVVGALVVGSVSVGAQEVRGAPAAASAGSTTSFQTNHADQTAVLNLAVTETRGAGYFQILSPGDQVGAFSNLNADHSGQTVAGLSFVRTDVTGGASVYSLSGGHEIVDVQGYMKAGSFTPGNQRLLDTRLNNGAVLSAGRKVGIDGRANATAVINLVATQVVTPGYVQVLSSLDQSVGGYSNLNTDRVGQTISRLAFVRFGSDGKAFLYVQGSMHLVADLQGYMSVSAFDDIADARILDTRSGTAPKAHSQTVIGGRPNSTGVVSIVATQSSGPGYVQVLSSGDTPGAFSNLNVEFANQTIGSLAFVRFDAQGRAVLYSTVSTHLVVDVQGYMSPDAFDDTPDARVLDTRIDNPSVKTFSIASWADPYPITESNITFSCEYSYGNTFLESGGVFTRVTKMTISGLKARTDPQDYTYGTVVEVDYIEDVDTTSTTLGGGRANVEGIVAMDRELGFYNVEQRLAKSYHGFIDVSLADPYLPNQITNEKGAFTLRVDADCTPSTTQPVGP